VAKPSQETIERLKAVYERWNAGDHDVDLETIHPDVELHTPLSSTQGTPYRGHEGFRQWIVDIDEQFEVWELHATEWIALEDERLLALGEIHARGRGSGLELDQELAWLFSLRDEKLIRYEVFYDQDEGKRVAGLVD
jgi:ketosteroid isomerase-like protein